MWCLCWSSCIWLSSLHYAVIGSLWAWRCICFASITRFGNQSSCCCSTSGFIVLDSEERQDCLQDVTSDICTVVGCKNCTDQLHQSNLAKFSSYRTQPKPFIPHPDSHLHETTLSCGMYEYTHDFRMLGSESISSCASMS